MSQPHHNLTLRLGQALRDCFSEGYSFADFRQDLLAGITVGLIAIPLAMALSIASGLAPQYGLYTVITAGFIIALSGGSRFSISGPTAAFVVILYPITQSFGIGGLMLATFLSGIILLIMAFLRLGRFIHYIPESVILGFTAGIAVVIFTLQIKDFFGLQTPSLGSEFVEKVQTLFTYANTVQWPALTVALTAFIIMIIWPRFKLPIPPHLPALFVATILGCVLNHYGFSVETIGSRFHYFLSDGKLAQGIPPLLPKFCLPWNYPGVQGTAHPLNLETLIILLPKAFSMALLGAIESLLCALVLDGMSGKKHASNTELLGQGLGNVIAPFFGGMTATAALARSAANFKAGAKTPVAGLIHAVVVFFGLVLFSSILAYLPMSAMAALLMMVAYNMSELPKAIHLIKTAAKAEVLVFFSCFLLTVYFDMVIGIGIGLFLSLIIPKRFQSARLI